MADQPPWQQHQYDHEVTKVRPGEGLRDSSGSSHRCRPFGLSTAAHLRARGIPVRVFGEPMVSWRDHMPEGMLLKSTPVASSLDAPQPGHTIADYCDAAGIRRLVTDEDIIPVETFIAYGEWFQQKLVPELERVRVVSVDRRGGEGFELKLDSGSRSRRGRSSWPRDCTDSPICRPSSAARRRTDPHPPAPSRTAPSTTTSPGSPARN